MKKLLILFGVFLLVLCGFSSVHALTYTDVYDAEHLRMGLFGQQQKDWTFDIRDDGFNPDTQDVTSALVELNFQDDRFDYFTWSEWALLDVGENLFSWEVDTGDVSFEVTSLMTLSTSGTLDASLMATWGDFYFNSATLSAEGTEPGSAATTPVPEPQSILLLGVGLFSFASLSRKIIK